jgi:uncharacterized protein YjiS (DUF1127 family)
VVDIPIAYHSQPRLQTSIGFGMTRFSAWRAYRATLRQLLQLGDRELDDIGIRRCEIPAIARRVLDHAPGHVPSHAVPRGRHVAA